MGSIVVVITKIVRVQNGHQDSQLVLRKTLEKSCNAISQMFLLRVFSDLFVTLRESTSEESSTQPETNERTSHNLFLTNVSPNLLTCVSGVSLRACLCP